MDNLAQFMAYAGDFERTLKDDDWSRLGRYFCDDAVYEVESSSFGCKLEGPTAIFNGMQKSLNGFDRKFPSRDIEVTSGPEIDGDWIRMSWAVTYKKDGWTPYTLRGSSRVRYRAGKIAYLADSYDSTVDGVAQAWMRENAAILDPRYV